MNQYYTINKVIPALRELPFLSIYINPPVALQTTSKHYISTFKTTFTDIQCNINAKIMKDILNAIFTILPKKIFK